MFPKALSRPPRAPVEGRLAPPACLPPLGPLGPPPPALACLPPVGPLAPAPAPLAFLVPPPFACLVWPRSPALGRLPAPRSPRSPRAPPAIAPAAPPAIAPAAAPPSPPPPSPGPRSPSPARSPPGLSTCWPLRPRKSLRAALPARRLLFPNFCCTLAFLYLTPWRCCGLCCQCSTRAPRLIWMLFPPPLQLMLPPQ